MQENYAGADIDYAPVRGKWFVLSGTMGEREFYERVSFTCDGQADQQLGDDLPKGASAASTIAWSRRSRAPTLPGAGPYWQCD